MQDKRNSRKTGRRLKKNVIAKSIVFHIFLIVCYHDSLTNSSNSSIFQFTIDKTNPQIDFSGGTENNNSYKSQNWIFINVSILFIPFTSSFPHKPNKVSKTKALSG